MQGFFAIDTNKNCNEDPNSLAVFIRPGLIV